MRFQIEVEDCHAWTVESAQVLTEGVSRTVVACPGCGQRRVLTCTNVQARDGVMFGFRDTKNKDNAA